MLQYKIPQNVGIEDKIVGPLTLRQLLILAGGFGISYVLFAIMNKLYELNILEYTVIALPGLLAVAFALVKINDIPLTKYIFLFLEYAIKPKRRVWDHRGISSIVAPDIEEEPTDNLSELEKSIAEKKAKQAANLTELTHMLDSGGFENVKEVKHADIDMTKDDDLVTEAYFGNKRDESSTKNMYWRTKESQMKRLEILASLPVTQPKKENKPEEMKSDSQKTPKVIPAEQKPVQNQAVKKPVNIQKSESKMPRPVQRQVTQNPPAQKLNVTPQAKPANQNQINRPQNPNPVTPADNPQGHKKRKRHRPHPQPVRANNQVNSINKNEPAKYIPGKPAIKASQNQKPKPKSDQPTKGEFDLRELQKGEIQINLD